MSFTFPLVFKLFTNGKKRYWAKKYLRNMRIYIAQDLQAAKIVLRVMIIISLVSTSLQFLCNAEQQIFGLLIKPY